MQDPGSKQRMIDATLALLSRSGMAGAGINQVVALSGAPKGSVYHHFPGGKQELVAEALRQFDDAFRSCLTHLWSKPGTADKKIGQFVEGAAARLRASDFGQGCPVAAVILDIDPESEPLREVCSRILDGWIDLIAAQLTELPAAQRREFAGFAVTALEGGLILGRARKSTQPLLEAGRMIAAQLGTIAAQDRPTQSRRRAGSVR